MFGRKKKHAEEPEGDEMMALRVGNADEAWSLLKWALERVSGYEHRYCQLYRSVRVNRVGDYSRSIYADGTVVDREPYYEVEFPRVIWDRALAGHTNAHAEKKVREEIFGKGK